MNWNAAGSEAEAIIKILFQAECDFFKSSYNFAIASRR
jgi:hypothetical protein